MKRHLRISLRAIFVVVTIAAMTMTWIHYKLPSWRLAKRVEASFAQLDVRNDEVFRAGSPILLRIALSTRESLRSHCLVGAWVDERSRLLHIAWIGDRFAADAVELVTLNGDVALIEIPDAQMALNRERQEQRVDYRIAVPLPAGVSARCVYNNAAVCLSSFGVPASGFHPISAIFTAQGNTQRCTGDRESALLESIEARVRSQ